MVIPENDDLKTFYDAYDTFDAFDAFDSFAHLVIAEHHESKKFYAAFDTFDAIDSNVHLVMAEGQRIENILEWLRCFWCF